MHVIYMFLAIPSTHGAYLDFASVLPEESNHNIQRSAAPDQKHVPSVFALTCEWSAFQISVETIV